MNVKGARVVVVGVVWKKLGNGRRDVVLGVVIVVNVGGGGGGRVVGCTGECSSPKLYDSVLFSKFSSSLFWVIKQSFWVLGYIGSTFFLFQKS